MEQVLIEKLKAYRAPIVGEDYYDKLEKVKKINEYPYKPCLDTGICDFYIKFYKDAQNNSASQLTPEKAGFVFRHLVEYSTRLPYCTTRQISNIRSKTIRDANGNYKNLIEMYCVGDIITQTYFCDPRFGATLNKPIITNHNPLQETVFKQMDLSDLNKCLTYNQQKSLIALRERYNEYKLKLPEYTNNYKKGMLLHPILASDVETLNDEDENDIEMSEPSHQIV